MSDNIPEEGMPWDLGHHGPEAGSKTPTGSA